MVLIEEIESPRAVDHKEEGNSFFKKEEFDAAVSYFCDFWGSGFSGPDMFHYNKVWVHVVDYVQYSYS